MLLDIIGKFNGSNGNGPQQPATAPQPASTAPAARLTSPAPRAEEGLRVLPRTAHLCSTPKTDILESGVEINGTLKSSHDLHFDGRIEGEIHSSGTLTVGENAIIKGGIKTRSVVIFGHIEGNIAVQDRCELKDKANVVGDITAGSLSIEEGASFMGQSKAGKQGGTAAPLTRLAA